MRKQRKYTKRIHRCLGDLPTQKFGTNVYLALKKYTVLLIENHNLNCALLCLVFSLLDPAALTELICEIFKVSQAEDILDEEDVDDLDIWAHRIYKKFGAGKSKISEIKLRKMLKTKIEQVRFRYSGMAPEIDFEKSLSVLSNYFELSRDEEKIIRFCYVCKQSTELFSIIEDLNLLNILQTIALCTGLSFTKVKTLLSKKSRLYGSGIIMDVSAMSPFFELNRLCLEYISGVGCDVPLSEHFSRVEKAQYPLESFTLPQKTTEIIMSLLKADSPCHILLHGDVGTGKSQYAMAVSAACGLKALFVQHGESGDVEERRFALNGTVQALNGQSVVVVDEADQFLNSDFMFLSQKETNEKGYLNSFFDTCRAKVIWICNSVAAIPTSVRRRVTYSWNFKPFTMVEREKIWNQQLKSNVLKAVISPEMVKELSQKFTVNAAGVGNALNALKAILGKGKKLPDKEQVNNILCELLRRHQELVSGKAIKEKLLGLTNQYDIAALNIDMPPQQIVDSLKAFLKRKQQHQTSDTKQHSGGLNLLFWGLPGCGKSEFSKYLSHELRRELVVKRASDLIDCYVGNTEKNIRRSFNEAQRQGGILFIDEADSFFTARVGANHSWEVTQTNELLTQMENFHGILICCTNLLDNLDKAALRRFQFKIQFKALTGEGKQLLYKRYFLEQQDTLKAVLTPDQLQRLDKIQLSAGDFKTVLTKFQYAPEDSPQHDRIIQDLANEAKYKTDSKKGTLGF